MDNTMLDNTLLLLLIQLIPLLYILSTGLYGADFFRGTSFAKTYKQPALIITIVTHVAFIGFLTAPEGYRLNYSSSMIMNMVALTLGVVYMFIEFSTKTDKTGFFVLSFATGAQVLASFILSTSPEGGRVFSGIGIGIHLFSAIFSLSAIAIAGLYSFLYILLFRQIKNNSFGFLFENLPSLEVLEELIKHAVAFGFLFLTITILAGVIGTTQSSKVINLFDPKLIALLIMWLLYGVILFIRRLFGWDTIHTAYLLIALFACITGLVVLMSIFSPTFHGMSF